MTETERPRDPDRPRDPNEPEPRDPNESARNTPQHELTQPQRTYNTPHEPPEKRMYARGAGSEVVLEPSVEQNRPATAKELREQYDAEDKARETEYQGRKEQREKELKAREEKEREEAKRSKDKPQRPEQMEGKPAFDVTSPRSPQHAQPDIGFGPGDEDNDEEEFEEIDDPDDVVEPDKPRPRRKKKVAKKK